MPTLRLSVQPQPGQSLVPMARARCTPELCEPLYPDNHTVRVPGTVNLSKIQVPCRCRSCHTRRAPNRLQFWEVQAFACSLLVCDPEPGSPRATGSPEAGEMAPAAMHEEGPQDSLLLSIKVSVIARPDRSLASQGLCPPAGMSPTPLSPSSFCISQAKLEALAHKFLPWCRARLVSLMSD